MSAGLFLIICVAGVSAVLWGLVLLGLREDD